MRICIHRGAKEIGGTCVEIESQGKRIVLDIGLPLDVTDPDAVPLHPVPGFDKPDESLLGVLISHPHQDHYGLAYRLPEETMFLIGEAAQSILEAADAFTPAGLKLKHVIHLKNREPISLGSFTITPYLVDHSAYDSYAVLVEANGKRLFYSGDFRIHGRKSKLVNRLIADPPKDVDVLLMEGTTLGRSDTTKGYPTEDELVPKFVKLFEQTEGLALVWASGQNIDRITTLYKACRKAKRQLILDPYTLHIIRATGNEHIPHEGWDSIRVFAPLSQRIRIKHGGKFGFINSLRPHRIFPKDLPGAAYKSVMIFRPSMIGDMDRIKGLKIGMLICSMWSGYLKDGQNKQLLDWLERRGIGLDHCHTSGHASVGDLRRLRMAMGRAIATPVHTEHPAMFERYFEPTRRYEDGCWWQI